MKNLLYILIVSYSLSQDDFFITIPATSYSEWIYFSFNSNEIIEINNPESSLEWDLAFQRKHIKTNSGLSGSGQGGGYVDSTITWLEQWPQITDLPQNISWYTDEIFNDFYDLSTHTFIEGTKNGALNSWGWFDEAYQLNPTNYVMFVRAANGSDIIKFWAYDFYDNGLGGNISIRYENVFNQLDLSNNNIDKFNLGLAYPNPFNPSTSVILNLPVSGFVSVKAYNLSGQLVDVISEGVMKADTHTFIWNASKQISGIYFIKAETSSNVDVQKVLLVK
jgi:hypothetical protein